MTDRHGEMFSAEDRTVAIGQTRNPSLLRLRNLRRPAAGYGSRTLPLDLRLMLRGYDLLDTLGESTAHEMGRPLDGFVWGQPARKCLCPTLLSCFVGYCEHRRRPHSCNRLRDLNEKARLLCRAFLVSRKG